LDSESTLRLARPADDARCAEQAQRIRALAAIARSRLSNAWLRLSASVLAALISVAVFNATSALYWIAGLVVVVLIDREAYRRILASCEAGRTPGRMRRMLAWTAFQAAYGNALAIILWFAPHAPSQVLAAMFLCGGLANALVTLRQCKALSLAALAPGITYLLGLPTAEFLLTGARDTTHLVPLIGALLLLAWGVKIWSSLRASDFAIAQVEAASLREKQSAAAAAAARAEALCAVADETRTPLAALEGALEHLFRAAATEKARAHLDSLAHTLAALKCALADAADVNAAPPNPAPCDPQALVRDVVAAFRPAAQDKGLELFLDIGAQTPASVQIDEIRVRQVLFNLISNAVRFTKHGGVRVRISAEPSAKLGYVQLVVSVADTGIGLSRSQLALMFAPQLIQTRSGLAIAIRVARAIGGRINARSELGQGSLFSFTLEASIVDGAACVSAA
jgi:signal transduction histidine kinase